MKSDVKQCASCQIACGTRHDEKVTVYEVATGAEVHSFERGDKVCAVAWSAKTLKRR